MRKRPNPRRLLVEGRDEQRLIPELIERNGIIWGNTRDAAIVDIEEFDGIKNLLKAGVIEAEIKASGLQQLGILVDADDDPAIRWNSVRDRCLKSFPNIPSELPADGLIVENQAGLRLGVWILPDNQNSGMLESFLCGMVAESGDTIYQHAVACVTNAKAMGAPFLPVHEEKARIHTWLAWQNPPGRQMHDAIIQKILIANSVSSRLFVEWFRRLYGL